MFLLILTNNNYICFNKYSELAVKAPGTSPNPYTLSHKNYLLSILIINVLNLIKIKFA